MNRGDESSLELAALRRRVAELEAELAGDNPLSYLHAIFDDMFEGIQIIDSDFRYVYLNETAAGQGRRAREDLVGRGMGERYPGIEQTEMFRLLQGCMQDRAPRRMINHFVYPDGRSAWFDLRISPVPMGILVLSVDISDQKAAEEELRRSREDLATTLECMAEGVIATDLQGRVTGMNPAAQALTGWPKEEGLGCALEDLVEFLDQKTHARIDHVVDRVLRDGLKIGLANDTLLVARDGLRIPIASSGAPIRDAHGGLRGVVLVLKDMKQEYELTAMLQQAQKMEALGRLAGGVAHDFNNLLTVIAGCTELLLESLPPADPSRDLVDQIRNAGQRAAALSRQLLTFSRRQVQELEIVDLNSVVEEAQKLLSRVIGRDIALTTDLEPRLGRVKADGGQLVQVITNLAVNAVDAMPQGGRLVLQTANVELDEAHAPAHSEAPAGRYVMLGVADTGVGMAAEVQARIFEPFFTTKDPGKGTGLGLSIVFGIVKQCGGHIGVTSGPGRGTTMKIYLPEVAE